MAGAVPSTLHDAAAALRDGRLTSSVLTAARLAPADQIDDTLGSYITHVDDIALEATACADADFAAGTDRCLLQGIPIGVRPTLAAQHIPGRQKVATRSPERS